MNDRTPTPTPLSAVLAFTFLNSIATGIGTSGIYFLTKQGYAFSESRNYLLGVVLGATYIIGAKAAGPLIRHLRQSRRTSRGVLAGMMVLMAGLCVVPYLTIVLAGKGQPPAWPVWLMALAYSPLTGVLWPMVESYLSGGRSGHALRSAVGTWNLVWSGALVFAFWGIAPFVQSAGEPDAARHAAGALALLVLVHVAALGILLLRFAPEPAPHAPDSHEPHPAVYARLLAAFRLLLPTSYMVSAALGPFLPKAIESLAAPLGIGAGWFPVLASAWLLPRWLGFLVLERWHGWHGRWAMPVVGGVLVVSGFAASFLASRVASGWPGLALQLAGLASFGFGMATIYCGAIYYALEVGQAEVDAGGTHEALIGVGYTLGPACGLAAAAAFPAGENGPFEWAVVGSVGGLAVIAAAVAVARGAVSPNAGGAPSSE